MANLQAFQSPEHQPFLWRQGEDAVLLVHGFPGTPAEMRPAGEALVRHGWTAQGLLLPGFGAEIESLERHELRDWVGAVRAAALSLRQQHRRVVLLGNSMGAALCLQVAAATPVDAVVLVAPYWRSTDRRFDVVFPVMRLFWRRITPFRKADFSSPEFQRSIRNVLPEADLDDPETQQAVRELSIATRTLAAVRQAGRLGYASAPHVRQPALVLQGSDDPVATPELSRQLAQRLPGLRGYVQVRGDHDLIRSAGSPVISRLLHTFLAQALDATPPAHTHDE